MGVSHICAVCSHFLNREVKRREEYFKDSNNRKYNFSQNLLNAFQSKYGESKYVCTCAKICIACRKAFLVPKSVISQSYYKHILKMDQSFDLAAFINRKQCQGIEMQEGSNKCNAILTDQQIPNNLATVLQNINSNINLSSFSTITPRPIAPQPILYATQYQQETSSVAVREDILSDDCDTVDDGDNVADANNNNNSVQSNTDEGDYQSSITHVSNAVQQKKVVTKKRQYNTVYCAKCRTGKASKACCYCVKCCFNLQIQNCKQHHNSASKRKANHDRQNNKRFKASS